MNTNLLARFFLLMLITGLLASCSKPVLIFKPLDVSRAHENVSVPFTAKEDWTYKFSLMFIRAPSRSEMFKQVEFFGDANHAGVPIYVKLKIKRAGILVFNEIVKTEGVRWGQSINHDGRSLNAAVRLIRVVKLKPGSYSAHIETMSDAPAFQNIESYIQVSYYNPQP